MDDLKHGSGVGWHRRSLLVALLAALCLFVCPGPRRAAAEGPDAVVVLGIDVSGSMGNLDGEGHARVRQYLHQILFSGFRIRDDLSPADRVIIDEEPGLLAEGLVAQGHAVRCYHFGPRVEDKGTVSRASDLDAVYPDLNRLDGETRLGDAMEHALSFLRPGTDGIRTLYWVYVSDWTLDTVSRGDLTAQHERVTALRAAFPERPILTLSVGDSVPPVYVEVRRYVSKQQIDDEFEHIRAAADELEHKSADPQTAPEEVSEELSSLRERVAILESTLRQMGQYAYTLEEMMQRLEELETINRRLQELEASTLMPEPFGLLLPEPSATVLQGEVAFSWEPSALATGYRLTTRGDGEHSITTGPASTSASIRLKSGEYEWTVIALAARENLQRETTSGWRPLVVGALSPTLGLQSPASGARVDAGRIVFSWDPLQGAAAYRLLVQSGGDDASSYEAADARREVELGHGEYTWWVEALTSDSRILVRSESRGLTTVAMPSPAPFSPRAPLATSQVISGVVTLSWEPSEHAIGYTISVLPLRGGAEPVAEQSVRECAADVALPAGAYQWTATAQGAQGESVPMAGGPVRFRVLARAADTVGPSIGLIAILVILVLAGSAWLAISRRPRWVRVRDAAGLREGKDFLLEVGKGSSSRIYLYDYPDPGSTYDVGASGLRIERNTLGVYLRGDDGRTDTRVRYGLPFTVDSGSMLTELVLERSAPEEGEHAQDV